MSTGVTIRPVIEEATKTITITVPPTWKLIILTVADTSTQPVDETTAQQQTIANHIPAGDRNAPYLTPAVLEALGFSNQQDYRDAHLAREYPEHFNTTPSDDESGDTQYQIDLTNKIQQLASARTQGWN